MAKALAHHSLMKLLPCILLGLATVTSLLPQFVFAHHKELHIAMFTQRDQGDAFWGEVEEFMRAACRNLGIRLSVSYANNSHIKMLEQVKVAAQSSDKPDVLLVPNYKLTAEQQIKLAEATQTPIFLFITGLDHDALLRVGQPREKFKYWIGSLLTDDEQAGFDLANMLIDEGIKQNVSRLPNGKIPLVGIQGDIAALGSINRVESLQRAIRTRSDVELLQLTSSRWKKSLAKQQYKTLMTRYPNTAIVWSASDVMASGVVEAAEELNTAVITGGVDWAEVGLTLVQDKKLVATMGGHFMNGGWAAVVLYDYFHGVDFAQESAQLKTRMKPLTPQNIDQYLKKFGANTWQDINFTSYSKLHNPGLTHYHFNLGETRSE